MSDEQKELLKYFIDRTDARLQRIEVSVGRLTNYRMMLMGGAAVLSALVSFVILMVFGR